ncbi:MAG TPA: cobalt ECF transporter T component CbiQ [Solirubrobacteraceae bacterium]|nr:cobalt ECF transporter T component CbiQ [Solirubrobacteraceae bacterium]
MALCNHALELTGVAGDPESPVHRLDPRAKVLGLVAVTVIGVSTPVRLWPVYGGCALVLAAVAAAARVPARQLWRRARVVLPLVLLVGVFVPLVRTGGTAYELGPLTLHEAGLTVLGALAAKATIGTLSAVLLAATTSYPAIMRALESLRVPRLFVLIASFMHRYLFVIVEELGRMRSALAARAYRPRHVRDAAPLGRVATAMFLRTYGRGERVYLAMLARGYDGRMPELEPLRLRAADLGFVALVVAALLPFRLAI